MTEIRLYFEGAPALKPGFRVFFREIIKAARSKKVQFNLINTGGKPDSDFRKGCHRNQDACNILLRDSEGPIDPTRHRDPVYWMVQQMEAWFLADPDALAKYYGDGFKKDALRQNPNVEEILRADVVSGLKQATRETKKREYHKTRHAPDLLERIDPARVRKASPNCERLFSEVLARIQ